MDREFKTLSNHKTINLIEYVRKYLLQFPETQILIGTDSQNHKRETTFAIVVALYKPGKGGHIIYSRWKEPRFVNKKRDELEKHRLMQEVWLSVETAEAIFNEIHIRATYIDIDINPDILYKSNLVLAEAVGLVRGMGYEVRWKRGEKNAMITYAADNLVK